MIWKMLTYEDGKLLLRDVVILTIIVGALFTTVSYAPVYRPNERMQQRLDSIDKKLDDARKEIQQAGRIMQKNTPESNDGT